MLAKVFFFLKKNITYLIILYVLVQIVYIIFLPVKFQSDSLYNYKLAEQCVKMSSFYPFHQQMYEDYIIAPLYINLLVVVLRIFNSTVTIGVLNIALNLLQLFFLYRIVKIILNEDVAKITTILYIFYLNTLGLVLLNYTELFFGVLVLASIFFYLRKKKFDQFFAGFFAAASIGVRPLGWALIAAYIFFYLYDIFKRSKIKIHLLPIVAGFSIFILLYGMINLLYFGEFVYTSTNGSVNILIGANDDATGAFNGKVFEKGNIGYINNAEKLTYLEKDKIYKDAAINWIEHHPIKWVSLIPVKVVYIFLWDDISISALANLQNWDFFQITKHLIKNKNFSGMMPGLNPVEKILYLLFQAFNYLYYILLIVLFLGGLILLKKEGRLPDNIRLILIFCIIGIAITMLVFGMPRFKYPYIIVALPLAAVKINSIFDNYLTNPRKV
jgi:hypothetical protein